MTHHNKREGGAVVPDTYPWRDSGSDLDYDEIHSIITRQRTGRREIQKTIKEKFKNFDREIEDAYRPKRMATIDLDAMGLAIKSISKSHKHHKITSISKAAWCAAMLESHGGTGPWGNVTLERNTGHSEKCPELWREMAEKIESEMAWRLLGEEIPNEDGLARILSGEINPGKNGAFAINAGKWTIFVGNRESKKQKSTEKKKGGIGSWLFGW